MAGTVVENYFDGGNSNIAVLSLDITGDAADGTVPATEILTKFGGLIMAMETNPGTPAPTANYDITLVDAEGLDSLQGLGANRHTSNSEKAIIVYSGTSLYVPVSVSDVLTLNITNNSVLSAKILIKLYIGQL